MLRREEMTAVLMCGGKSSRMGYQPKQWIKIGDETFQDRILRQFQGFGECAISGKEGVSGCELWKDKYQDIGPLGGIHASLSCSANEYIFIAACDMVNLSKVCIDYLIANLDLQDDCLIPVADDRPQPLCAIYHRRVLGKVEEQIKEGDYKIIKLFKKVKTHYLAIPEELYPDFSNVNTMEMLSEVIDQR